MSSRSVPVICPKRPLQRVRTATATCADQCSPRWHGRRMGRRRRSRPRLLGLSKPRSRPRRLCGTSGILQCKHRRMNDACPTGPRQKRSQLSQTPLKVFGFSGVETHRKNRSASNKARTRPTGGPVPRGTAGAPAADPLRTMSKRPKRRIFCGVPSQCRTGFLAAIRSSKPPERSRCVLHRSRLRDHTCFGFQPESSGAHSTVPGRFGTFRGTRCLK